MFCDCLLFVGSPGGGWVRWERLWNNVKFHLVPHLEECLAGDTVNSKFHFLGTSLNISYITWFELAIRPRPQGESEPPVHHGLETHSDSVVDEPQPN